MIFYITAIALVADTAVCQFFNDGQLAIEPHFTESTTPTTTTTTTTGLPTPPLIICEDKISNCQYYRSACQATGAGLKWATENCPKTCDLCSPSTTPFPLNGCKDSIAQCSAYGKSVCTDAQYTDWVNSHCPRYCARCACYDEITNCAQYGKDVCNDYRDWAMDNCKVFCGFCNDLCQYKEKTYSSGQTWEDDCQNCTCLIAGGGQYNCTRQSCPAQVDLPPFCYYTTDQTCCPEAYCKIQSETGINIYRYNASLYCEDKLTNCASYPEACGPQYKDWAQKYCARSCHMC